MKSPTLFLYVPDHDLRNQLLELSILSSFTITMSDDTDTNWIHQATEAPVDVVLAMDNEFNAESLVEFEGSELPECSEVLFVSDGTPNEFIDGAMLAGASYHLRTPLETDFLAELLNDLLQEFQAGEGESIEAVTSDLDQFGLLLGSSRPMRKLFRVIRKAANSDVSVFIIGESGVGKELVASTIHLMSDRRDNTFMTLNCGAISPELIESELFGHVKGAFTGATSTRSGIFEQADGSTLFLDEVTEMPLEQQVKLLRVLESGEFRKVGSDETQYCDVRVVCATNKEPVQAIQDDLFREDLYFRLAQFPINVPPLRDRGDDIVGLARHFLAYRNSQEDSVIEISETAIEKIRNHTWPGNVRDLKHTIERACILSEGVIEANHLVIDTLSPETTNTTLPSDMSLEEVEKQMILQTLEETDGKKQESAERLGISVKTLYNKLEKYRNEEV